VAAQRRQIERLFVRSAEPDGVGAAATRAVRDRRTPVQRVTTPVPRTFEGMGASIRGLFVTEDVADRGKYFRAHLETLQWQLLQGNLRGSASWTEMERLLGLDDRTLAAQENAVVTLVRDAPPAAPSPYAAPDVATLDGTQKQSLDDVVRTARREVSDAAGNDVALESVFGAAQKADAAAKFRAIAHLLDDWSRSVGKPGPDDRVRINRSTSHYSADCEGRGDPATAKLMLGSEAFATPVPALVGTLVHEGSHGALGTSDLAYIGSAVFAKLTGTALSTSNADHFKLALDVAAGRAAAPQADGGGRGAVMSVEESLQQGAQLCAYKCHKVKRLMDWTIPLYQEGRNRHDPALLDAHERRMDLGGPARGAFKDNRYAKTSLSEIAVARSESFALALRLVGNFVSADRRTVVDGNVVTCTPKTADWQGKSIRFDLGAARSPVEVARILFVTTLADFGIGPDESRRLFDWSDAVFDALLRSANRADVYHQTADEMALYDLLRV
jgi:hypothetical protein